MHDTEKHPDSTITELPAVPVSFTQTAVTRGKERVIDPNTTDAMVELPLYMEFTTHGLANTAARDEIERLLQSVGRCGVQCLPANAVGPHDYTDPTVQLLHVTPKEGWEEGQDFTWQLRTTVRASANPVPLDRRQSGKEDKPFPENSRVFDQFNHVHERLQFLCDRGLEAMLAHRL